MPIDVNSFEMLRSVPQVFLLFAVMFIYNSLHKFTEASHFVWAQEEAERNNATGPSTGLCATPSLCFKSLSQLILQQ